MIEKISNDRYSFWQSELCSDEVYLNYIAQKNLIFSAAETKRKLEEALLPAAASSFYDVITQALK